jgi:hypothetical protein
MAIEKKNDDIKDQKNKGNLEQDESMCLERQPSREGLRPRICASQLRRFRLCACGRTRALTKRGHHWRRLSACRHCLRIPVITSRIVGASSWKESGND